jgi:CPA1 family monovalent cation:H+ antiporter
MIGKTANYQVEIMVTLALAMSGYAIAGHAHVSAPIAIVVAGLMIGSRGRATALTEATRYRLDDFWELVDEILNAVLFVIIGLEVLAITMTGTFIVAGLVAIPLVLVARLVSVGLPFHLLRRHRHFEPGFLSILTWGGLRGGISVALALSLPEDSPRDLILTVTYIVVVFSVLVQGLTLGPLVRTVAARSEGAKSP